MYIYIYTLSQAPKVNSPLWRRDAASEARNDDDEYHYHNDILWADGLI